MDFIPYLGEHFSLQQVIGSKSSFLSAVVDTTEQQDIDGNSVETIISWPLCSRGESYWAAAKAASLRYMPIVLPLIDVEVPEIWRDVQFGAKNSTRLPQRHPHLTSGRGRPSDDDEDNSGM